MAKTRTSRRRRDRTASGGRLRPRARRSQVVVPVGDGAPDFACDLTETQFNLMFPNQDEPETFGLVTSDEDWLAKRDHPDYMVAGMPTGIGRRVHIERKASGGGSNELNLPDGARVRFWSFRDENGVEDYPSTPVRLMGGDLLQCDLSTSMRQHTIHWHGIEPDMDNDGVGHTSFEVTSNYTYQWRAHPANPGTYFYHCHVNTVLHFQMGLWGALIIDPYEPEPHPLGKKPQSDSPDEWRYKPEYERIWAINSIDPSWHKLNHAAGACFEDAGLNDFRPKYFGIGGHFQHPDGRPIMGDERQPIAVSAPRGENILLRLIIANYFPVEVDFGALADDVYVIESDGRGLRTGIDLDGLGTGTFPVALPWNEWKHSARHRMAPAERYGLLVKTRRPGVYPVEIRHRHWVSNQVVAVTRTQIEIT
jgi:Multicopper oxidase